jgi:tetratricopeptide (TPR) repeat protein
MDDDGGSQNDDKDQEREEEERPKGEIAGREPIVIIPGETDPRAVLPRIMYLQHAKRWEEAAELCGETLEKLDPPLPEVYFRRALCYEAEQCDTLARRDIETALGLPGVAGSSYEPYLLSNIAANRRDWDECLRFAEEACKMDQSRVEYHIMRWYALSFMGRSDDIIGG